MDILQAVASGLAVGAAAGLEASAAQAVKDAYAALRRLVARSLPEAMPSIEHLEQAPESAARRAMVAEDLSRLQMPATEELAAAVRDLLAAVERDAPQAARRVAVDLADLRAGTLELSRIRADAEAVRLRRVQVDGALRISDVDTGPRGGSDPNA